MDEDYYTEGFIIEDEPEEIEEKDPHLYGHEEYVFIRKWNS